MLRYWQDFIPSWAGAISIDLLPVVLVLVLTVVNDALRREQGELADAETISAAEMLRAMALYRQMNQEAAPPPMTAPIPAEEPEVVVEAAAEAPPAAAPPAEAEANVTALELRKRGDGPVRP